MGAGPDQKKAFPDEYTPVYQIRLAPFRRPVPSIAHPLEMGKSPEIIEFGVEPAGTAVIPTDTAVLTALFRSELCNGITVIQPEYPQQITRQ